MHQISISVSGEEEFNCNKLFTVKYSSQNTIKMKLKKIQNVDAGAVAFTNQFFLIDKFFITLQESDNKTRVRCLRYRVFIKLRSEIQNVDPVKNRASRNLK